MVRLIRLIRHSGRSKLESFLDITNISSQMAIVVVAFQCFQPIHDILVLHDVQTFVGIEADDVS